MSQDADRKPDRDHASGREDRPADKKNPENAPGKTDKRLDEALEETFPSSDPVSVKVTK